MNSTIHNLGTVIVSWNVKVLLLRCIQSLLDAGQNPSRIVVVDNASKDGSAEAVRLHFPEVILIRNMKNEGFAAAVNQGIQALPKGHLLILNPDCMVKPDTLRLSMKKLTTQADIGVLGCRLVNSDGSAQESVRAFPRISDQMLIALKLHRFFPRSRALRRYYLPTWNYNADGDVDQVKGAFFLIHERALQSVGLFDTGFFIWFEEVDYCYRVRQAGLRVSYTGAAEAFHARGESFRQVLSVTKQWYFLRSMRRYFAKHGSTLDVIIISLMAPLSMLLAVIITPISMLKIKTPTAHD